MADEAGRERGMGMPSVSDWRALSQGIGGDVVRATSDSYDSVRKPAGARFHDIRPQAVVRCQSATDVAEVLSFTRRFSLATAIRSGGHDFAGHSSTSGVVIDVTPLDGVALSGDTAIIGAGARLGDVYRGLHAHGRTIPAGCGPTVGIAGLTLGGGLGVLGRAHGLTCDRLVQAQVVLADGRTVECDEHRDSELFWALRGGGAGQFGVVTALAFATIPAPRCTVFELTWDYRHASNVVDAWQNWAPDAPEPLAASLLLNAPADSRRPPLVTVQGAGAALAPLGTDELLDDLITRVGAEPRTRWRQGMRWLETKRCLAERAPAGDPGHLFNKSEFFRRLLPREAIDELVAELVAARVPGEARELDFSPWGGAYNRVPADATAFPHRGERFLLKHAAMVDPSRTRSPAAGPWLTRSWRAVRPWGTGRVYPNFPDPDLTDPGHAYFGDNLRRLTRVKEIYDPDEILAWLPRSRRRDRDPGRRTPPPT